jgi:hypothetical protein
MIQGVRKSLSREEHAIRMQFDATPKEDALRAKLWKDLQKERRKGVQQKQRLFVKVRLKESTSRIASCLVADLRIVSPDSHVVGGDHETRIDAYAPCEMLFDTDLPPCDRSGNCPHDLVVYVMEADNVRTVVRKRAWDALQELAGR